METNLIATYWKARFIRRLYKWLDMKFRAWQYLSPPASTYVLHLDYDRSFLPVCHFQGLWQDSCGGRPYWIRTMSSYRTKKIQHKKTPHHEEEWEYLEEGILKKVHSARVCMTCQHFNFSCDRHCRTLLVCHAQKALIPHGEHLNSRCQCWIQQHEREIGWSPEVA